MILAHLTRDECHLLAAQLGGDAGFPEDVLAEIVARGDGVALFIEELSQAVLESGGATMSATIPATLRDTLTARLDRLGAAKANCPTRGSDWAAVSPGLVGGGV